MWSLNIPSFQFLYETKLEGDLSLLEKFERISSEFKLFDWKIKFLVLNFDIFKIPHISEEGVVSSFLISLSEVTFISFPIKANMSDLIEKWKKFSEIEIKDFFSSKSFFKNIKLN